MAEAIARIFSLPSGSLRMLTVRAAPATIASNPAKIVIAKPTFVPHSRAETRSEIFERGQCNKKVRVAAIHAQNQKRKKLVYNEFMGRLTFWGCKAQNRRLWAKTLGESVFINQDIRATDKANVPKALWCHFI
jgi:hypothetical protein